METMAVKYRTCTLAVLLSLLAFGNSFAVAFQPPGSQRLFESANSESSSYQVDVRVLMQSSPVYAVKAQEWNRVFQRVGYPVIFDTQFAGKQLGVQNVELAGRVRVQVTGVMDAQGQIQLGKHKFVPSRIEPLKIYLDELKKYGADGPPRDNPSWGLSDDQFKTVLKLLSPPVDRPINMRTPVDAIDSFALPLVFRVRFTEAARRLTLAQQDEGDVTAADVTGVSIGSALAIVLAQSGLGFRPLADTDGGFVLEIDAGGESDNLWPVGWKNTKKLNSVVPTIFRSMSIGELENVQVTGLIQVIANHLKLPHFYSSHALSAQGIDVTSLTYSHRADRLPPSGLMRRLGDKFKMGLDIRTDEAGNVFLWVTTRDEYSAFRDRFSHIVPGSNQAPGGN
jgi:hypothetical protein